MARFCLLYRWEARMMQVLMPASASGYPPLGELVAYEPSGATWRALRAGRA
jgi:hypothetical protein